MEKNITKTDITSYIKDTKIKFRFAKQVYIGKISEAEELERRNLIKKINSNNVLASNSFSLPENILNSIPKSLRIFPRDFATKEDEIKLELNEENKKTKVAVKNLEKKSLEDIISSNNYYGK